MRDGDPSAFAAYCILLPRVWGLPAASWPSREDGTPTQLTNYCEFLIIRMGFIAESNLQGRVKGTSMGSFECHEDLAR